MPPAAPRGGTRPRHGEARSRQHTTRPAQADHAAPRVLDRARRLVDGRRRTQERSATAREVASTPVTALDDAREYAYVARDLKDILRIAILLLIVLFVLYIAIDVTGVLKIT